MTLLGIGKQVKSLSESSGVRNIGSRVSSTAMRGAERVASGQGRKPVAKSTQMVTNTTRSAIRGGIHPGSTAGWKGEKTVLLAHNDTGYYNKANQKARYTSKKLKVPTYNVPVNPNHVSLSNHTDFRIFRNSGSSPSILKRRGL